VNLIPCGNEIITLSIQAANKDKKEHLDLRHLWEQNSQLWHIITSLTRNIEILETPKSVKWHISFKLLFLSKQMAHADTNLRASLFTKGMPFSSYNHKEACTAAKICTPMQSFTTSWPNNIQDINANDATPMPG
jgi:hypothetical protein